MTSTSAMLSRMEQLSEEYNRLSQYLTSHPRQTQQSNFQGHQSEMFNPQSETTASFQRSNESSALRRQITELSNRLQKEYTEKKALEQKYNEKDHSNTQIIVKLKNELRETNDDTEIVKDVIKRLNEQLNRYHIKYGPISSEGETHRGEQNRGKISRSSLYKLRGLLVAYDEVIKERDAALKSATEGLEKVMVKVDGVTKENEKLHTCLERLTVENPMRGDVAERVAADARILLEERELLMQEVHLIQQKRQQEAAQNQDEVSNLHQELEENVNKTSVLSSELSHYRDECSQLEQQCKALQEQLRNSVTKDDHQMAVDECARLFEQLRSAYSMESGELKHRYHANKSEKQHLAKRLTDTSAVMQNLSAHVSGLKGSLRKNQTRVERREKMIHALNTATKLAQSQLKSLARVCSELLEDRSRLLVSLSDQRKECEELAKDVTLRRATIGALSQKLKEERVSMSGRLAESEGGRRAAKASWKRTSHEAQHLRTLLHTKDDTITSLIADYRILGLDISEAKHAGIRQRLPHSPYKHTKGNVVLSP